MNGTNNNTIVPTKTPTIEPKYIIIIYSKTTRINPPIETPIEIIIIPILEQTTRATTTPSRKELYINIVLD